MLAAESDKSGASNALLLVAGILGLGAWALIAGRKRVEPSPRHSLFGCGRCGCR